MRGKNTKYLIFIIVLSVFFSCGGDVSTGNSGHLSGTWIFTAVLQSSNKSGYTPNDTRYNKYKYLDLNSSGKGVLWGGNNLMDGVATWDEKNKWIELQAKDSAAVLMDFEKFTVDSVGSTYLKISHLAFFHDTTVTKEIFFKK
ncbi:MAG: hypothetical protein NT150_15510 [Bacteroidetes bacterium]|nr:hypothetical protein [Bacteroidota bacterium]